MTGRELIIYILENHLEDAIILNLNPGNDDVRLFSDYMDINQVAAAFNVGPETIRTWVKVGVLDCIQIGNTMLFSKDAINAGRLPR